MDFPRQAAALKSRQPTLYIPHGGGPCFFMEWPAPITHAWDSLAAFLRGLSATLPVQPRAIVVISAHWEAAQATVTSRIDPPLLFDYYGFPPETYNLRYDAPGSPAVAARVQELLRTAGIPSNADARRGFDHGVFVPFKLIVPDAAIPIVQLSLVAGLDAAHHLKIGRALTPLRDDGILIVGSGMSYHNVGEFLSSSAAAGAASFDTWLSETAQAAAPLRDERLRMWHRAPHAELAHPREEHLLPLMVAAGAAGADHGTLAFSDDIFKTPISRYRFG